MKRLLFFHDREKALRNTSHILKRNGTAYLVSGTVMVLTLIFGILGEGSFWLKKPQ